ncbi:probable halotolerance protein HAL3 (contains flavoprotein domain) [Cephalotrichum gorgonifer]|uniref:Probable halotolerance protein HAL3 (Contains flavoprotein domain) n=1 Tax=Cephalotrichum gorgonifer TaxID=2041049 RepID=A0AAE8SYM9_9PEZI|nr:probable halotolerance protein HAL3 (contains flavoprotein domain) [Cephalotrichum gorgonifer]
MAPGSTSGATEQPLRTAGSSAAAVEATLNDGKHHLLLAASGSVATIKLPLIVSSFAKYPDVSIRIILTRSASQFLAGQSDEQPALTSLAALPNVEGIHQDEDEWAEPWTRGAKILHIALRRWAHILVVAPLSANTLAKTANGISDNLLTSVIRAWDTTGLIDGKEARILVAPAMNTAMYAHPITAKQIRVLEDEWGVKEGDPEGRLEPKETAEGDNAIAPHRGWFEVLRPIEKSLACGDVGSGAMMEWTEIVKIVKERLGLPS